jgi:hypothetical protein
MKLLAGSMRKGSCGCGCAVFLVLTTACVLIPVSFGFLADLVRVCSNGEFSSSTKEDPRLSKAVSLAIRGRCPFAKGEDSEVRMALFC